MKLFHSGTSPYVRKVMVTALFSGVDTRIKAVPTNPHESPAELLAANPLSKVPCLLTEDGVALFDSPVICEYLDNIGEGGLFPPPGPARWRALKQQAIGDGLLDAAVSRRMDAGRPAEDARTVLMNRNKSAVSRALDVLEADVPADHVDIGTITVGCALGYLDLRFAEDDWRAGHPKLAAWYEKMAARPEFEATKPQ